MIPGQLYRVNLNKFSKSYSKKGIDLLKFFPNYTARRDRTLLTHIPHGSIIMILEEYAVDKNSKTSWVKMIFKEFLGWSYLYSTEDLEKRVFV